MFIGHFAPALVLQRARPSVKLWQLFLAVQFVDLLWPIFILLGIEHARIVPGFTESNGLDLYDMPWSHSLVATLVWGLIAFIAWRFKSGSTGDALVISLAVMSHFVMDLIVHVPDLPLASSDGVKFGFGLWRHLAIALPLELVLFGAAGFFWWSRDRSKRGLVAIIALMFAGVVNYVMPPPPNETVMAVMTFVSISACAAFIAWAEKAPKA
jgi:hypothetical protein